jgi:hypothetical protein
LNSGETAPAKAGVAAIAATAVSSKATRDMTASWQGVANGDGRRRRSIPSPQGNRVKALTP